jgi:hypothetical protein
LQSIHSILRRRCGVPSNRNGRRFVHLRQLIAKHAALHIDTRFLDASPTCGTTGFLPMCWRGHGAHVIESVNENKVCGEE